MSTLKSPLSRGSDAPHVHQRLRKHLARCTSDCGFKTPESPALRGFVGGLRALATAALYLVLKSNGPHRSKKPPVKFGFSLKTVPANIAKKLPPQVPSQTISHHDFQLLAQTPHVCFHVRKRVHTRLCSKDRTQRPTRRNRGCFRWGAITTLGAFRTFTNIPGPGIRTASFAAFGAWSGVLPKNVESLRNSDALMRVAVPRRRGPAGCVICLQLGDVAVFSLCAQYFLNERGGGVVSLPSDCFTRCGNPAWPGGRTANFAAFGSWSETLLKNAESLRDSDALMCVAVPRRRGPAGLRGLFRFCRSCGLYALFQILLSVLKAVELVLLLCKLRLGSFLFGSELFKGFRFCHCA